MIMEPKRYLRVLAKDPDYGRGFVELEKHAANKKRFFLAVCADPSPWAGVGLTRAQLKRLRDAITKALADGR